MTAALRHPERQEWTVDDLAGLSDDHRYELINGRLVVTSPIGPHNDLSVRLLLALEAHCPPDHAPFVELSVLIDRHNQPRPDVVAARLDRINQTPLPVADVVLVVEVLSKENTLADVREKEQLYARAGVPCYWVVNPLRGPVTLTEHTLDPARRAYQMRAATGGVFEADQPWPVRVDLAALTERYERLLALTRAAPAAH